MIKNTEITQLTPSQVERYSRHLIMPNVGSVGQRKLINSKILVVGAGGLGSPVSLYLALAGVGTIGIIDFDVVEITNLQRQILHEDSDIGRRKVISAKETLERHNPEVNVVTHETPLNADNAMDIISNYDIVINGADNFATRYLLNDATQLAGKILVSAALLRFEGQLFTFKPDSVGPCYRCVFAEPPPPDLVPRCEQAGIFGALCGVMGSLQATEVLKELVGIDDSLAGHMLLYDALGSTFRKIKLKRDPDCKLCGNNPAITDLSVHNVIS